MAIATWNGVEIPEVTAQDITRLLLADEGRTAGGAMRRDVVLDSTGAPAVKRVWRLETGQITKAQADAIIDNLTTTKWAAGAFWLDEFGVGNTVQAYVSASNFVERRTPFSKDGDWQADGRTLSMTVIEQ
jgi:hypothetical protein